jgi:integrase
MGLGGYPEVSLSAARLAAATARAAVKDGRDPVTEKEAAKIAPEAPRPIPAFRELAATVIASQKMKTANAKVQYQWERHLGSAYCSPILDKPVNEIRTVHIHALLEPVWHSKPEVARKLLPALRRVFELGRIRLRDEHGIEYTNPANWPDLKAMGLAPPTQLSRGHHPSLPHSQLPAFFAALQGVEQVSSLALQLLILTCVRTDAVIHARWDDIDRAAGVWSIPIENLKDKKTRREAFRVPLSTQALAVLEKAAVLRVSEYVFPGSRNQGRSFSKSKPMSNMAPAMLIRRLGDQWIDPATGKKIVPHGFRATFKTWSRETRQDRDLVEECLGHVIGGRVERAYDRTDVLELRRELMQDWSDYAGSATDLRSP